MKKAFLSGLIRSGGWGVVLHRPQILIPSSGSTTPIGRSEPPATRTDFPPARRGASLPAKPYAFVRKHHAYRPGRASGDPDVVLHHPQSLISSSGGTTSLGPNGLSSGRTWCLTLRKALFLRSEAPRLSAGPSLRRPGRGASPSAKPYFFVRKHHAYWPGRASGDPDVVLHCQQILIPSSGGTTSLGPNGLSSGRTWCLTLRKALFLRSEAPRLSAWSGGASVGVALPAKP